MLSFVLPVFRLCNHLLAVGFGDFSDGAFGDLGDREVFDVDLDTAPRLVFDGIDNLGD